MAEVLSMGSEAAADCYAQRHNVLRIAGPDAEDISEAVAMAGLHLIAEVGFAEAAARLMEQAGLDMIALDARGAPEELLATVLARVDALASERLLGVVVALGEDQIDLVSAQLLGRHAQLLCDPTPAQWVVALALAHRRAAPLVADGGREAESARLQRLNEEVARIADTLARLTRGEEPEDRVGVRSPASGYRGGPSDGGDITAGEIRGAIRARRIRNQFFDEALFADPAWDMLLDLFAAELEQRRVSVSSLCIAAAVPPTTALRWISTMHDAGLFQRHADPSDRRRAYIGLSQKGVEAMRGYVLAVKRAGLGIA
jgi:hypothetical protein